MLSSIALINIHVLMIPTPNKCIATLHTPVIANAYYATVNFLRDPTHEFVGNVQETLGLRIATGGNAPNPHPDDASWVPWLAKRAEV